MKRPVLLALLAAASATFSQAQNQNEPPPVPPPVAQAMPRPLTPVAGPSMQRLYGPSGDTLISRQTAEGVLEGFRRTHLKDGAPRIVVCVNRPLVDTASGPKLASRVEQFEKAADGATKTSGTNTYRVKEAPAATLADRQTVREIERLFGRVFRSAGAQLADPQAAASLLPETPGGASAGEQAARDRKALADIADIAIEVLISSRNLVVPEVSGDVTRTVPDIQATAIRLKDAAIVGQASASDVLGKGAQAGRVAREFDVRDITEATAIALMEDMLTGRR